MLTDLPPAMQERIVCSIASAVKYGIPANIMLAIAEKEGGRPGQWVRNDNGTYDVGPLQFNTAYLRQLESFGIKPADVAAAGCYPYTLAAWRLRQHIHKDSGDLWKRCANYHSRTPRFNARYRQDLMRVSLRWAEWLAVRYPTYEFSGPSLVSRPQPLFSAVDQKIMRIRKHRSLAQAESGYVARVMIALKRAGP